MLERSAIVNRFGELSSVFTPDAAVTFCSVITPTDRRIDVDDRAGILDVRAQHSEDAPP